MYRRYSLLPRVGWGNSQRDRGKKGFLATWVWRDRMWWKDEKMISTWVKCTYYLLLYNHDNIYNIIYIYIFIYLFIRYISDSFRVSNKIIYIYICIHIYIYRHIHINTIFCSRLGCFWFFFVGNVGWLTTTNPSHTTATVLLFFSEARWSRCRKKMGSFLSKVTS